METIAQITTALAELCRSADEAAWRTGFIRRPTQAKLSGAQFVLTLVFGFLRDPQARRSLLAATAGQLGVTISPQGLDQRLEARGARCLQVAVGAVARAVVRATPATQPLLDRFAAVYVQDSTVVALPDALAGEWAGCGGRTVQGTQAAVKLQVRLEVRHGQLAGPDLQPGRDHDQTGPLVDDLGEPGSLHLRDLGYFSVARLAALSAAERYWLTRAKVGTWVRTADGADALAPDWLAAQGPALVDQPVQVGQQHRLPARLVAGRVPLAVAQERRRKLRAAARREGQRPSRARLALADWTVLLTNVPPDQVTAEEAGVLLRVRWQIELLFKLWKQDRRLAQWRSAKPWAILCELYAKLIGLVLQHWLLLVGCWAWADRSLVKAARLIAPSVGLLVAACRGRLPLAVAIAIVAADLSTSCRLERRRRYPSTAQLLADPSLPVPFRPRYTKRRGRKRVTALRKIA